MEGRITFWMYFLVVLYICNHESVNANLREKYPSNDHDLNKIKIINKELHAKKIPLDDQQPRSFPCPPAENIAPCICSLDQYDNLSLNCDAVESEQQLAAVFQQDFPAKRFKTFRIYNNRNIEKLHDIFNGVTFEHIDLNNVYNLNFISDYLLLGSVDTLNEIDIYHAPNLTADNFPFVAMEHYSQLQTLDLQFVPFGFIPKIRSQSLISFMIVFNEMTSLEPGFLAGAPNVCNLVVNFNMISSLSNRTIAIPKQDTSINLAHNSLQYIQPGAFYFANETSLMSKSRVIYYFHRNNLTYLEAGLIKLRNGLMYIYFNNNSIKVIEKGAFELPTYTDSLGIEIILHKNNLTTIDESVFGELMPFVTSLDLSGNPLTCGCDIFWLISNPDYMTVLESTSTCDDGKLVVDLDVQEYEKLCT